MILGNIIIIFCYLVFGYLLQNIKGLSEKLTPKLSKFIVYISVPAVILLKVPGLKFGVEVAIPVMTAWLALILSIGLVHFSHRVFHFERKTLGCLLLLVGLGNTSFLGFPMIEAFLGDDHLPYGIMYDQLGSFFALSIYGSIIISLYKGEPSKPDPKKITKKILLFPPFLTLVFALFLDDPIIDKWSYTVLEIAGAMLVPVAIITVGLQLKLRFDQINLKPLVVGLGLKMIDIPLILFFIFWMFDITGMAATTSLFEAAMPPMITAGILAIEADLEKELAASMVGFGILLSFITLPLFNLIL